MRFSRLSAPRRPQAVRGGRPFFTLESARASLVYIRRIVHDIVAQSMPLGDRSDLGSLRARQRVIRRLIEELHQAGVELRDMESGQVDFPASCHLGQIAYVWHYDQDDIVLWRDLEHPGAPCRALSELPGAPQDGTAARNVARD